MTQPLFLGDPELEAMAITPSDIRLSIEAAIRSKAAGGLLTAPKSAILPGGGRYLMSTLATSDSPALSVVKCVTVAPENPGRGLASILGAIMVFDSASGALRAVMDAGWITAVRTAGLSAVAAKRLANPTSSRIGFIGCGVQARSHLDAFQALFPLREIRAFGRGAANRDRLLDYAAQKGLAASAAASADEALDGADLIVTSVPLDYAIAPFLDARRLKPGAFAAVTDLGIPWFPESLGAFETLVVDDRAQEAESPKKMAPPEQIGADLTELVAGAALGFESSRRAAFMFRGLALGDFAVAALALERASNPSS